MDKDGYECSLFRIYALHPDFGINIPHLEESYVKKQMIKSSNKIASLVTRSKLNTISNYVVAPLSDLDYLITVEDISDNNLNKYRELDIEIIKLTTQILLKKAPYRVDTKKVYPIGYILNYSTSFLSFSV